MENRSNTIWGLTHESNSRTEEEEKEGFGLEAKRVVNQGVLADKGGSGKRRWLRNSEKVECQ